MIGLTEKKVDKFLKIVKIFNCWDPRFQNEKFAGKKNDTPHAFKRFLDFHFCIKKKRNKNVYEKAIETEITFIVIGG